MKKKLAIIILDASGARVKQLAVSRFIVVVGICLLMVLLAGSAFLVWDYGAKKQQLAKREVLRELLAEEQGTIREQQKHLKAFVNRLDKLSKNIVDLARFENDIRVIANLEPNHAQESVFGIGGSAADDYESGSDTISRSKMPDNGNPAGQKATSLSNMHQPGVAGKGIMMFDQHPNLLAATPAIRPAEGTITTCFKRSLSNLTDREEFHQGLDIVNEKGTAVVATAEGRITFAGSMPGSGKTIIVDHGFGYVTEYTHLDEILVQVGEPVKRGQQIATMGSSGPGKMSQLHYEVHLNGIPVDPSRYILQ